MPRKKDIVRAGAPVPRIKENSRLMRTHESMVDYLSGRSSASAFMDVFAPALFGFNYFGSLEDDLIYSDEEDDDEDDVPSRPANRALEPHPQIKQLTDEEADKIAKELIEEEKRNKEKTERNKRKKMRKKEKKRLEKENALKEIISEEEQGKSDSSENQEQTPIIDCTLEANESFKSSEKVTVEAGGCGNHGDNKKEKDLVKMNKDEEVQQEKPQKAPKEEKKNKSEVVEVQQPEEEKPDVAVKPEAQKKMEEEPPKEKSVNPKTEEFAKRSIELANMGNRLAAAEQYETAVNCFTDAIRFNPRELKLFGNRSLCYERLQQYEKALRDADVALSMEPNWIKGLFRKGKALCGLKRYYEASLVYKEVLKLESKSLEAAQELKRAQTLHLMEMGFSWPQSSEALKTHATLEEAVEALFASDGSPDAGASWDKSNQAGEQEDDDVNEEGDWVVLQTSRPRKPALKESDPEPTRLKPQWPFPGPKNTPKPELFPVWVRTLAPAITYAKLHEVFSRAGRVFSIKMLLDFGCAYVNYTRKEDSERAIQLIDGMVVEGAPLSVQYPSKVQPESSGSSADASRRPGAYKRECFFWRTTGCTRDDCTFRHVPEHKNIDKDKFTGRLGYQSHAGNYK